MSTRNLLCQKMQLLTPSTFLTHDAADSTSEQIRCLRQLLQSLDDDTSAFYARKQLLLSARLSQRNSVCASVTRVDQSKTVQAKINKSSPSAVWKTLVSETVKLFHKFEEGHPERGR